MTKLPCNCPKCGRELTLSDDHVFEGVDWQMAMCLKQDGGCGWESARVSVEPGGEILVFPWLSA